MWCISIQQLDYDDYPLGPETKIGPFTSEEEANGWMERSGLFWRAQYTKDYFEWKRRSYGAKHSVRVKPLVYGLVLPEDYKG